MKKLIITFAIFLIGCTCFAENFQTYKMDNGHTFIIKEVKENPIVIIDTWIKTGSINETDKNNGVAHFLEHMFFKGTEKYPSGQFDSILESKGAVTNAATSKDFTHYYITIPSKDFELALKMHADMMLNPQIPRNELEKEREVVLEEIAKNKDNPQSVLYNNLVAQLYQSHPYKREVIGTQKVIETITREEMLDFYHSYYNPANMTTVIVGDVDSANVIEKINKYFVVNSQKVLNPRYIKEKPLSHSTEKIIKSNVETGYMLIGFRGVDAKNKKQNYVLDVLATILGDGSTSRFYKSVKDQKRLVQSIASINSSSREDGIFIISAKFKPENLEKVKRAILEEINYIQKIPPQQEELQKAFKIIERDTYYSRESVSNIASEIGYIKTVFDDINMYDNYISEIEKVTAEEVSSAAKKFLDTNKMAISVILPQNFEVSSLENNLVKNSKKANPILVSENELVKKYKLENNATLLFSQNKSNDIIAIKIYAKGGKLIEKIPGISLLVAEGMMKGTQKYAKNEFAQILEEKGIKLSANTSIESFDISLKTTKNEFLSSLDLLNESLNNAVFDEYELEKIKTDALTAIKTSRDKPFNIAIEEFKDLIYQNSPYSKSTSKKIEKELYKVKRQDVFAYYTSIFNPNNIVISINGNLTEEQKEQVINYFTTVFKAENKNNFDFNKYKNTVPQLAKNNIKKIKKDTQSAWITLGWQTCGIENQKDYIVLQVINSIMGTGMSSRLFEKLRDQQGLAYQIGSVYSANVNKGFFLTYIGTNPLKAEHAKKEILKEIDTIKTEFVTQKELQAAKDKLIGNFILAQETNSEKASSVGWFEATNRGYDFAQKYSKLVQEVTASDVIAVANKYLSKPYVLINVSP